MASSTEHIIHTHTILGTAAEWVFRESGWFSADLSRYCNTDEVIEFKREATDIVFCILDYAGPSHLAASPSENIIKVTVY
jgi:hypothetical protein